MSGILGSEIEPVPSRHPFRLELREWLGANVPSAGEPLDHEARFAFRREWQRRLFAGGWAGPTWPEAYGGRATGAVEQFMYYEEMALARAPEPVNTAGTILVGPTLIAHGTEELKERFLPGILSGDEIWCQGFSEPDAGSDLAALRMRARREDGDWVLDGQKTWMTFAPHADWCFVLCRSEPGSKRHRGLSTVICPMDAAGVTMRPIAQITGDPEFAEVFFDSARTPLEMTVGDAGGGWAVAMTTFQFERSDQGFTDHGRLLVRLADVCGDLRRATKERTLSPAAIAAARHTAATLWIRCQQLRRFNLRAAIRMDEGEQIGFAGSAINLFWSELEKDMADLAAAVLGARGLMAATASAHHLLNSRAASIYSGTNEIQRNIVAERMLGLPREPAR